MHTCTHAHTVQDNTINYFNPKGNAQWIMNIVLGGMSGHKYFCQFDEPKNYIVSF